ncbi:2383_t:CDS:2 [Cetraspora pellucida]|uniref:2383_t:CDS:1 n=1 Tax=Cetraspora pellucida TaxID=1433469 RepID=A0A9N8VR75_9GLOM|nr:2383_t:CDS:2 [Cetraspora pellucida]
MNANNEDIKSFLIPEVYDQKNDKVEDAFLAFFDDVGGPEMAQFFININKEHFKEKSEESDYYSSEENNEKPDEENLLNHRMDVDYEEENYKIGHKPIEVLIDKKKKDFHDICSIMTLNPKTMKTEACNKPSARRLWNLIGNWEINSKCLNDVGDNCGKLGVCDFHFNMDQRSDFHQTGLKNEVNITSAIISFKNCLFCNQDYHVFTRGINCKAHAWRILGKDILLPCLALYTCKILHTDESVICERLNVEKNYYLPSYICQACININGGHIHTPPGQGKMMLDCTLEHKNETSSGLHIIGNWILDVAASSKEELKRDLLIKLTHSLTVYWQNKQPSNNLKSQSSTIPPSVFIINTCLKLGEAENLVKKRLTKLSPEDSLRFGQQLGKSILQENKYIQEHEKVLESPTSLLEYYNKLPEVVTFFFRGMISILLKHRFDTTQRQHKATPIYQDPMILVRIVTFFVSIILTIAYKGKKFWVTYLLASICRRPNFLASLQAVLHSVYIVAHTQKQESRLEKQRMKMVEPHKNLLSGPRIWNLAVIDNIDFIPQSFKFGNIFDIPRKTLHATLRMVLQYTMPVPIYGISEARAIMLSNKMRPIFEISSYILEILDIFSHVFKESLGCTFFPFFSFKNDFDNTNIHKKILSFITKGCSIDSPNIVILEAGGEPNDDEGIFESCEMYSDEIELTKNRIHDNFTGRIKIQEYLDIASDESIFRRTLDYKRDINPYTRTLLDLYKNEYTSENIVISRKEKMWTLALEILNLFENPNQTMHKLLYFSPELNFNGYNLLFTAYEKGKSRMEALLKQEVYGTEPRNTYGRRDREVNIYTYAQIQELFTQRITKSKVISSKLNPTPIFESIKSPVENNIPDLSSSQSNHDNEEGNSRNSRKRKCNFTLSDKFSEKKVRRVTKDSEKSILDVFAMKFLSSTPANSDINEVLSHLDSSWDRENVLQYVRNARKKFKGKM